MSGRSRRSARVKICSNATPRTSTTCASPQMTTVASHRHFYFRGPVQKSIVIPLTARPMLDTSHRRHCTLPRVRASATPPTSAAFPSLPQLLVILRQRSLRRSRRLPTKDLYGFYPAAPPGCRQIHTNPSARKERGPQDDKAVFRALAKAGQRLAEIHVHYEQQPEFTLTKTEKKGEKLDYRVNRKMKLR